MKLPITISGTVMANKGRGRRLGYPTANIPAPARIPEGLYAGYTHLDDKKLPSLIFIGASVTFGETDAKAEIHVLDFSDDLYGKTVSATLEEKLRDNIRFDTKDALIAQMKRDERSARAYFTLVK
jgi:riboflavin kinase/FMN adenylyltransferase